MRVLRRLSRLALIGVGLLGCASNSSTLPISAAPSAAPVALNTTACGEPGRSGLDYELRVASAFSGTDERVLVHLTPCAGENEFAMPVLYLLHGAGADETQWADIGMLRAIDAGVVSGSFPPSVIVIPDASSQYRCGDCDDELAAHLLDEIEPAVAELAVVDPSRRAIGGISRGGGFALRIASNVPARFVAVGAHSPVGVSRSTLERLADSDITIYLDVGSSDGLADRTRAMATDLERAGAEVQLHVSEGGHDRTYWRGRTVDYADFYGAALMSSD